MGLNDYTLEELEDMAKHLFITKGTDMTPEEINVLEVYMTRRSAKYAFLDLFEPQ